MQAARNCPVLLQLFLVLCLPGSFGAFGASRFASADVTSPDFFPIFPWDPLHGWKGDAHDWETNGLESIAECNFNVAGFVWPEDLPRCRKLGLAAIVVARPESNQSPVQIKWNTLSDEQIE